jgi:hypothetical protein
MFQPKVRRALASAALVSALSLLPVSNAGAEPRARREGREVSERVVAVTRSLSFWDLLARVLAKASVRIDPDGNHVSAPADPADPTDRDKASVRIDPDGRH